MAATAKQIPKIYVTQVILEIELKFGGVEAKCNPQNINLLLTI